MDPVGLVGTLLAILQVSSKLVSVCYEYRAGVKGARRDISRILDEIISVRAVVEQLIDAAEESDDRTPPVLKAVTGPNLPLQKCLSEMNDLKKVLKLDKEPKSKSVPLLWPLKQKEVDARLAALGRIKSTLQLALSADTAQNMVQVLANTLPIPAMHERLSRLADSMERTAKDETKADIISKIHGRDMEPRHQEHCSKRASGTGDWVLNHETYVEWKDRAGSLLWLSGHAGSGKTVLCSRLIDDIKSECFARDDTALIYFYVDGSDHQPLDVTTLYRTFVRQLVLQIPGVPRGLDVHYRYRRENDLGTSKEWRYRYESLLHNFGKLFIVLDALDECQEFIDLNEMMTILSELLRTRKQRTHLLVSSRDLEQVRQTFTNLEALQLAIGDQAANADMPTAVHGQLFGTSPFKRWPSSLKREVERSLLAKASGSFYWISCQLNALKKCVTPAGVQEKLRNLPETLESHYLRELNKLEAASGQSVRNVLRWIACSSRSLSIAELTCAITINIEDGDEPFTDASLELFDVEGFLDSCSSLVTTYRDTDPVDGSEFILIRLAHFSVLEFLRSRTVQDRRSAKLALEGHLVHSLLAKSCLIYIQQFAEQGPDDLMDIAPFIPYTASSWLKHKQQSFSEDWNSREAQQMLMTVFDAKSNSFRIWLRWCPIDRPWLDSGGGRIFVHDEKINHQEDLTPLYCAAYSGLENVVKRLLEQGADPGVKCGIYGHALQAAAHHGYVAIVGYLLKAGADVNAQGGKAGSAIAAAAAAGHTEVVKILLEAKANLRPAGSSLSDRSDDPLFQAASRGHLDICNLLLDHGARDYHAMKGRPCTALAAAVQIGRIDIVKTLLQHQRIHDTNRGGCSGVIRPQASGFAQSQWYAASFGYKEILRELLGYGITDGETLRYAARAGDENLLSEALAKVTNIDEEGSVSDHPRALQSAALGGHLSLVQKLLALGADPNMKSDYSTALQASVSGGNLEIAKVLIQAGAQVNVDEYSRPLRKAIYEGRRDFMDLFVQHGADTHHCLIDAVSRGNMRDFEILLELGADIHYRKPESEISILQAAAFGGSVGIVRYLLDNTASLGEQTQTHPLTEAIRSGHLPVVDLLLSHSVDVNASPTALKDPGSWGGVVIHGNCWPPKAAYDTPLSAAIRTGRHELARRLIESGALVSPPLPSTCGTPLLFSIWEEAIDILHLLLEKGADPNKAGTILQRSKPNAPLILAAEKGNIDIATALINAGADINLQDDEGFSACHVTAGCPNTAILRLLIQDNAADITLRLKNGSQPIHSSAARGTAEHVQILIDAGADINARNDTGRTPLHWAADAENCEIVELLLDLSADARVKADEEGLTAWDLACLAKEKPWYAKRKERGDEGVMEEKAERMRERLREAAMGRKSVLSNGT